MVGFKKPITVLVVDDHPLIREGITAVVGGFEDISVVGEASNGLEAIRLYRATQPDVTLMDVQMPELNGIGAISSIMSEFPQARIAVLTTYRGDVRALQAIKAGARGYLLKSTLRHELIETIRTLAAGKRHFPPEIAAELTAHIEQDGLSPREVQVLQHVANGLSNKELAVALAIGEDTVKGHLSKIMDKLGAGNRTHAVVLGIQRGIIELSQ
ncbi:response regulator transcription factor [Stutzerimonas nitrititolerans]|uniref:response regulator transcription factor n=1 Tax=Stutzerimonas nitrititolerans TaxID=2482751 RepID=UPI0007188B8D|nr:response regulator transcription factor [Stutzerimonas nitrititolerans]KRW72202.1 LuxR family transcriptional regulator [Pseudomonas sp. TTU2014-096BSC]